MSRESSSAHVSAPKPSAGTQLADGRVLVVGNCRAESVPKILPPAAAVYGTSGWTPVAAPPFCHGVLAALPSGGAIFAARDRAVHYEASTDRWVALPRYRFPHAKDHHPAAVLQIAPVAGGALLVDRGLNRYSATERFLEAALP